MRVVGLREPFAMATPDYLEQVVISGRRRSSATGAQRVRSGIFHRPSVTSLIWAALDLMTVAIAALLAARHLAQGGLQPVSRGPGDAQRPDRGRRQGSARAAQSPRIAAPPGLP